MVCPSKRRKEWVKQRIGNNPKRNFSKMIAVEVVFSVSISTSKKARTSIFVRFMSTQRKSRMVEK